MGIFTLWADDVSRGLEKKNKNTATLWKLSNLFFKLFLLAFVGGFVLLLVAAFISVMSPAVFGGSTDEGAGGLAGATADVSYSAMVVLPVFALLLFILSGLFSAAYSLAVAILAFQLGDSVWGVASALLGLPALYYKYKKGKELAKPASA